MLHRISHHLLTSLLLVSLLFGQALTVSAQSLPEAEVGVSTANSPATTETVLEATTALDREDAATTDLSLKQDLQATDKAVASVTDNPQSEEAKRYLYLPMIGASGPNAATADAAQTQAAWQTIKYEGFEGVWPNAGWSTYDCNGTANGNYFFDDENWIAHSGGWSGWPAGNALNPRTTYYPNNACAWMIYGPFSLASAQSARLLFNYWNQSERNFDYIGWYYSCDGVNFTGFRTTGDSAGWRSVTLGIGCYHDSTVWIGYKFTSDFSNVDDGPFIDDIYLQRYQ